MVVVFACVEVTASVVVAVVVFTTIDKERLRVYVFYHKNTTQKSQFCRHPKHLCLFFFFIMIYLRFIQGNLHTILENISGFPTLI